MGADGVPREQAELAEMEVRAEGSRRGFSKLGGAPGRNGIPCLFREPRSCGKSFASLDAAQFRCAAEQSKKGYTRVETRKACLGAKSTRLAPFKGFTWGGRNPKPMGFSPRSQA